MEKEKIYLTDRTQILKKIGILLEPWLNDTCPPESLNEQTRLLSDLGLDSVAILQLLLGIEKELHVVIKDHELDSEVFSKMGNLIDIIESKLSATN
jgi:acyl carrier protein